MIITIHHHHHHHPTTAKSCTHSYSLAHFHSYVLTLRYVSNGNPLHVGPALHVGHPNGSSDTCIYSHFSALSPECGGGTTREPRL
eukprot:8557360-Pyramimonas_sp.AAC.1